MSITIKFPNFETTNIKERSNLAVQSTAGAQTLTLFNNQNFAANDPVLLGRQGSELGEIVTVSSLTGQAVINVSATTLDHEYNSSVIALNASQIKVYRALNSNGSVPVDGDFNYITTISIDPDQLETAYVDSIGSSSYWYKATYYNSTSSFESTLADALAVRGDDGGLYATVDEVKEEAGFDKNRNVSYIKALRELQEAQAYINGRLSGTYTIPFATPINPYISRLTKVLAAGYLQLKEFGSFSTTDTSNGNDKTKWVDDQIELLISGKMKLISADGSSASQPSKSATTDLGMSGWPNNTTTQLDAGNAGAGDFRFRVSDVDGYNSRAY